MLRLIAVALTIPTGFSGLVYEVTWQKYFAILLGSHSEATAAILGIFLAGLSAGYSLFGRVTARVVARAGGPGGRPRLFLLYALVEAGVGVYALVFPWLFEAVQALSFAVPHAVGGVGFAFDMLLVALLVGPPTLLMGGTIPILTQALATGLGDATRFHALVYGFNTAGAFAGALAGSFVLVPGLGLHDTMRWMAAVNLASAAAFALFELSPRGYARASDEAAASAPSARPVALLALVALLTGFAMMVVQNVSMRLGALAFGSSEYTFGTVVAVFVLCIALGSLVVSAFGRIPPQALVVNQLALLAYTGFLYTKVESLPAWALYLRSHFGMDASDFLPFQSACFAGFALVLGPMATLSGATLPLLFHHLRRQVSELGAVAGALYSWNTVGSFLGAVVGSYALLFFLDLHQVFRIALLALAASCGLLAWQLLPPLRLVWAAALCAALVATALLPPWDPRLLTMGLFRDRHESFDSLARVHAAIAQRLESGGDRLIFHDDDPIATITVRERTLDGELSRALISNGKGDSETGVDTPTTALLGLVPAVMIEHPRRAFVIGYGTGVTVGELASLRGMERVVVAEISPGVVRAAPLFDFANRGASRNPRVEVIRSDAYRALMRSQGRFDVIVSEPSNPWTTGVEMLYSLEFLRAARQHLAPGGVHVQWFHQYESDEEAVSLVLRTFAAVFDRVAVWYGLGADFLILGMEDSHFVPRLDDMQRRAARPDIRAGLRRAGVDSFAALLAHELFPMGVVSASDRAGPIHTLFHPRLNHVAGRAFFRGASGDLPPLETGAQARIGARNSLLRRLLARLPSEDAERARRDATAEACRYRRTQCLAFLADWMRLDPGSPELARLRASVYRSAPRLRVGGEVTSEMTESVMRVAAPDFVERSGRVPLPVAERATDLYRRLYQYAMPFDGGVLVEFWRRCQDPPGFPGRCRAGLAQAIALDGREGGTTGASR